MAPFTLIHTDEGEFIKGQVTLNRKAFGVGGDIMIMDDYATVQFYLPLDGKISI